jgi:hypothetical protein
MAAPPDVAWMLAGLVALVCLLCCGRRMTRMVDEHTLRAIEEFRSAIAPLILLSLLWLIADPPPRRCDQARLTS